MSDYNVTEGSPENFPDTSDFIDSITSVHLHEDSFFTDGKQIIVTRAPGRLDVMGGIADYSGSLVLQLPIASATHVALQKADSTELRVLSLGTTSGTRFIEIKLSEFLFNNDEPIEYAEARRRFANSADHWAAYVTGTFLVLMREKGTRFECGAHILVRSSVPEGKGVSSSAALEVAVMQAVMVAFDLEIAPQELARLCQKVENLVAGAPCGIMDQMTSVCGEENRLLELLCQPDILKGTLALPDELELWGVDSGVRHSVSGSDYATVRTAAFMGYRIIADIAKLPIVEVENQTSIADSKWSGYLANITPSEFKASYETAVPPHLKGDTFLNRYFRITDDVTTVNPNMTYPVRQATRHPIYENARVQSFASILKNWRAVEQAQQLGSLMFESHQSYSDCGLGSEATDLIVNLVRESLADGLFGARITGGGSGGTVAVLGHRGANAAIENVRQQFHKQTGHRPLIISGSSPGATVFDHLTLEKFTSANKTSSI